MEFLVNITVQWPPDGDEGRKAELVSAEADRARTLQAEGTLRRLWRIPGQWANVGVWEAADATALHEVLASLPFFPWLEIKVIPLARHPSDPGVDC